MDLSNSANRKILEFELIRLEALYRRADQIQFCTYIRHKYSRVSNKRVYRNNCPFNGIFAKS